MGEFKTPGVYIKEKNAFGNSVVEAETAIPAFIGFTQKAVSGDKSLLNKPWKISSMTEFTTCFGGADVPKFNIKVEKQDNIIKLGMEKPDAQHTLYYQMLMFFANGGSTCYIVSVGDYSTATLNKEHVKNALTALEKEQEVTMIVVPEAVYSPDYANILTNVLQHCGSTMKNRIAILDIQINDPKNNNTDNPVDKFRDSVGGNYLSYGAAYYPWLNTSVVSENDINPSTISLWDESEPDLSEFLDFNPDLLKYYKDSVDGIKKMNNTEDKNSADTEQDILREKMNLHNVLFQNWPEYRAVIKEIKECLNLLPPSAAMAGIYTAVDNSRGVWKAPANVTVSYADSPTENINDYMQEGLNMPMNGKAVNAIRSFPGEGVKVWGARTLDGNSQDWRYVNVRRTMLFLEESVKNAARAYVFEPNDANTWINMKCMIENFLRSVWKRGGLAGAVPEDAFEVHVGLGDTMTGDDILEGILRITVLVAISRPAEFIEITFQQQMQKS